LSKVINNITVPLDNMIFVRLELREVVFKLLGSNIDTQIE